MSEPNEILRVTDLKTYFPVRSKGLLPRTIAQVKAVVPPSNWCNGKHTPEEKAASTRTPGFLDRLLGRGGRH